MLLSSIRVYFLGQAVDQIGTRRLYFPVGFALNFPTASRRFPRVRFCVAERIFSLLENHEAATRSNTR